MKKINLDLCGGTGSWSLPYKETGYDVKVITVPEYDILYTTYENELLNFRDGKDMGVCLIVNPKEVYGILAAPPCTMFSFVRTTPKRPRDLVNSVNLVYKCLEIIWFCQRQLVNQHQKLPPLKFWALENPYFGMLNWYLGKPAFIFQPYEFGDGYKKKTALWGKFNEPIKQEKWIMKNNKKFDSLLMEEIKALKSPINEEAGNPKTRKTLRAITPRGFALAFYKANK